MSKQHDTIRAIIFHRGKVIDIEVWEDGAEDQYAVIFAGSQAQRYTKHCTTPERALLAGIEEALAPREEGGAG